MVLVVVIKTNACGMRSEWMESMDTADEYGTQMSGVANKMVYLVKTPRHACFVVNRYNRVTQPLKCIR